MSRASRPVCTRCHTHPVAIGVPHTVVLAEELSTETILAGPHAGRSWITESSAVDLSLKVSAGNRSAGLGERLETRDDPALVQVDVHRVIRSNRPVVPIG